MKYILLLSVSILFLVFTSPQSIYPQSTVPGGYVSGTWTAAGSPYLVQGSILIHADSTLNIEPGVVVEFQGNYSFTINGFLQATGTAIDSIHFTAVTTWMGLEFNNAPDSSHLAYCTISGSATLGGIRCIQSNPVIIHSRISGNSGLFWGGIYLVSSNPSITYSTISNNSSNDLGGGIRMEGSSPHISYCSIAGNYGNTQGGGIYISWGNPSIDNCTISNNKSGVGSGISFINGGHVTLTDCIITAEIASGMGGGIFVLAPDGSLTISNSNINTCKAPSGGGIYIALADSVFITGCTFESNLVNIMGAGGAVYINQADMVSLLRTTLDNNFCGSYPGGVIYSVNCSNLVIDHCNVVNNHGAVIEGGIHLNGNTAMTVKNCIFKNQVGIDIWFENYASASVMHSDFAGPNSPFAFPPSGLGTLVQTNINGDSCDVFYNIYLDPLFVDFPNGDYHLSWANWPTPDSTKSPCIDAGDPLSQFDPDGTITDQGVFAFDQSVPVELVSFTAELAEGVVMLNWVTATETNNKGFEIERRQESTGWIKIGFVEGQGTTTETNVYSYSDDINGIRPALLEYRLKQIDYNGSHQYSNEVSVEIFNPLEFKLYQNYPNPFNPNTTIKYSVPQSAQVQIKVFDVLGKELKTLVSGKKSAGNYELAWNASDLPSGVYFYQLIVTPDDGQTGGFFETKKMILMK